MPGHPLNNNPPEAKAPLLLLLPVSIAEHEVMRLYGMDYPLDQFWSAVPEVCPPSLLPTPRQLTAAEAERKKTLTLWKHCSATGKTPVLSTQV